MMNRVCSSYCDKIERGVSPPLRRPFALRVESTYRWREGVRYDSLSITLRVVLLESSSAPAFRKVSSSLEPIRSEQHGSHGSADPHEPWTM